MCIRSCFTLVSLAIGASAGYAVVVCVATVGVHLPCMRICEAQKTPTSHASDLKLCVRKDRYFSMNNISSMLNCEMSKRNIVCSWSVLMLAALRAHTQLLLGLWLAYRLLVIRPGRHRRGMASDLRPATFHDCNALQRLWMDGRNIDHDGQVRYRLIRLEQLRKVLGGREANELNYNLIMIIDNTV